jgi:hypothetical protein
MNRSKAPLVRTFLTGRIKPMTLRRKSLVPRHLFAALAIAAACGAYAHDSNACGGGWYVDPAVELHYRELGIASAEKQLEEGRYDDAAGSVLRVIPHISNYQTTTKDEVINRAMRVLAVAAARQDGKLDIAKQLPEYMRSSSQVSWVGDGQEDRATNLSWSVRSLRAIHASKTDDVVAQSELGEALATVDAHRGEAREILEALAKKDLLTSPEAYKALAKLRAEAGDKDGRTAALERCRAMAKDAAICKAPSA